MECGGRRGGGGQEREGGNGQVELLRLKEGALVGLPEVGGVGGFWAGTGLVRGGGGRLWTVFSSARWRSRTSLSGGHVR